MNPWEIYKVLLICILFGYRYDLVTCADSQGGTDGAVATPTTPVTPKSQPNNTSLTKVDLNIKTDASTTNSYDYSKDDSTNSGTYTCKEGFGFGSVKQDTKEVWNGKGREHANKVVVHGDGNSTKNVTVYLANGKSIKATKSGGCFGFGQSWSACEEVKEESTAPTNTTTGPPTNGGPTASTQPEAKEGTPATPKTPTNEGGSAPPDGSSDGDRSTPTSPDGSNHSAPAKASSPAKGSTPAEGGTTDKSKLTLYTNDGTNEKELDTNGYTKEDKDGIFKYTFKEGVNCTAVKYDGKEVWKHGDESVNEHPIGIIWFTKDNDFSITFEKKFITCTRDTDKWNKKVTNMIE